MTVKLIEGYLLFNPVNLLDKYTVIMSNDKTYKNFIFRSSDIFEDRSEEIQKPGHA